MARTSDQVHVKALQTFVPLPHAVDHAVFLLRFQHQLCDLKLRKNIRPGVVHDAVFRAETVQHAGKRYTRAVSLTE